MAVPIIKQSYKFINGQYRAYVRDCKSLNTIPKAFLKVKKASISEDLLASANSKFTVDKVVENIDVGDIFVLLAPSGATMYYGVITNIEDREIQCSQMQSFYKGTWLYERYSSASSLEAEVAYVTNRYSQGQIYGTSTVDSLFAQLKGALNVQYDGSTNKHLSSQDSNYTKDFEEFIYSLYEMYSMTFEFCLPYTWTLNDTNGGRVVISIPDLSSIKIGNNVSCISNITPTTKIYETNKLIVYDSEGEYRGVYYGTSGGIVTDPDDPLRLKVVNTNIVFSDDEIGIIKAQNLRNDMYNHILEFDLRLDNNLYDWTTWKLGTPLEIYFNSSYFNTVYTGYSLEFGESKPTHVHIVCGKVRNTLSKRLLINGVK